MDHFGIGAAMQSMVTLYLHASRRSGRTTSLLDSVDRGDRIVFAEPRECERVKRLLRERRLEVECIVVSPREPEQLFVRGTCEGRTLFDHAWVEEFYRHAVDQAAKRIDRLQRESSGFGEAHRATQRAALEISRFR